MNNVGQLVRRWSPRRLKRALKRLIYIGGRRYCPVCEKTARAFEPFGVDVRRAEARCPTCGSLERHRMIWRYLQERTNFFQTTGVKMLHVAPEGFLEQRFRRLIGAGYLTADLYKPADGKMDVADIQFPDATFDIVYCSHVLEHVPDDRRAIREFHRVLKPDGWAIVMVPITVEQTIEDPTVADPAERLRLFGQDDHVRRYGVDFVDRLREAGFDVTITKADDFLTSEEIVRIGVENEATGEIFHCTRD